MALETKILTITKPTIALDEISMLDFDDKDAPITVEKGSERPDKVSGSIFPLVQICDHKFNENEISGLRIDETGFIPTITISVGMTDGNFLSNHFPKDGDPMSIFIRSQMDEFNPIRADWEITSVNSMPSTDPTGDVNRFTIEGVLRVPNLYAETCKSFSSMTSYNALLGISQDLKLGFATNETTTNDKMTWVCPFDTYDKFIKDITLSSYKDDNSFYRVWLDHNYYMNFVNVNQQFGDTQDIDQAMDVITRSDDWFKGRKLQKFNTLNILTNHGNAKGMGNFIKAYTLLNNAGQVVIDNGYRRYAQWWEEFASSTPPSASASSGPTVNITSNGENPAAGAGKYQSQYVEPLNSKDSDGKILLKGRVNENFFNTYNKHKWMGTQYSLPHGNVHANYLFSHILNWQNNQELDKMKLRVQLGKINYNLYRGQKILIAILNYGHPLRQKTTADPQQSDGDWMSIDKFLTGYYVIDGMRYTWNMSRDGSIGRFEQELILTRREWPIPNLKYTPSVQPINTVPTYPTQNQTS